MASISNVLNGFCEICGMENIDDKEIHKHLHADHSEDSCICPICNLGQSSKAQLITHVNHSHPDYLSPQQEMLAFIDEDDDNGERCWSSPQAKIDSSGCRRNINLNSAEIVSNLINNSPQRNHLALNLENNAPGPPLKIKCPLCPFTNTDPCQLEEHVNRQHFDVTSPLLVEQNLSSNSNFSCPLCVQLFSKASDLESHVNIDHKDILSPAKPTDTRVLMSSVENNLECPICSNILNSTDQLKLHIDDHFSEKELSPLTPNTSADQLLAREIERQDKETQRLQEQHEFELLKAQYGMDDEGNFKKQSIDNMKKAVLAGNLSWNDFADHQIGLSKAESSGLDDGLSCTQNLIPAILAASRSCSNVAHTLLCSTVDYYASTYGDRGWGCGYRNTQMILSSLLQHTDYNERVYQHWHLVGSKRETAPPRSAMPCISQLQKHIEWAWSQGFDLQGSEQLGAHLVNTRKWIGATEVVTILSSLRIRCQLIDFHRSSNPNGTHPELFDWVLQYFRAKDDFKPPLYLQHQGHSRTIIGVEILKDNSVMLLLLDPSHTKQQMDQLRSTNNAISTLRLLRKTLYNMKAKQYQIVIVCGMIESEIEYEKSKVLSSIQVPQKW